MDHTIVIGDIHGCMAELNDLLDAAGLPDDARVVSAGDFLDRGPDSPAVARFFRERHNAIAVLGNHERKHLGASLGKVRPALSQRITREQLGSDRYAELLTWLDTLPLWLDLGEALVVHGYWQPGVSLEDQHPTVLAGTMTGQRRVDEACGETPWYELYDGPKPLIVAHHDYREDGKPLTWRDRVFGLDTSCVHGRRLTGLLLPSFRVVSVPGRDQHWTKVRRRFAHVALAPVPDDKLSWEQARALVERADRWADAGEKVRDRAERVRSQLMEAETARDALYQHLLTSCEAVLSSLREEERYDELEPRVQAQRFAQRIGKHRFANLLHRLRRHGLDLDELERRYPRPVELVKTVRRAGLVVDA